MVDKMTNQVQKFTIKGKEYMVSPIGVGDYGKLIRYLKQLHIEEITEPLRKVGVEDKELTRIAREIIEENWEASDQKLKKYLGGYDATIYLVYLSLSKQQKITLEEIYDLISTEDIETFGEMVKFIGGGAGNSPAKKGKGKS